ncbi:CaiB/BaiF CoA transferase family protein [Desulfitobacterium hafniense]|nr:CaiB/BaiF CoA-transferase family protein [Desulfitobacterium hafniense]EHL05851.1 III protein, CoA-transferase family [Desulfitobacterium hafniense DP7]KTE91706.1 CoA-transferase [Desulfitobacterium hafniense]
MAMLLQGIRVLDLSRLLPGPFCTMTLADMGAEVLKIEDTQGGDYMRTMGKPVVKETMEFLMHNRNKKSMRLNLKTNEGRNIFLQLVKDYDVILESFRPGVVEQLGVGYQDVREVNPNIIYCSLSGYGQNGPYRTMAGHDTNYLSIAGVLDSIGVRNGPPVMPGITIADIAGGSMWAIIGILAAIIGRRTIGRGEYIDVAMMDGVMPFLGLYAGDYFTGGGVPKRGETVTTGVDACCHIYATKDGRYVSLAAAEPKFWKGFCQGIGRPELAPLQYSPDPERAELIEEVSAIMKTKTQAEWTELLMPLDICFTPVKNLEEALADPQVQARNLTVDVEHPVEGTIRNFTFPVKFAENPAQIYSPPPLYGEHTVEVLKGIGYSEEQIKELEKQKVI